MNGGEWSKGLEKTTAKTIYGEEYSEAASKSKFFFFVFMNGFSNNDLKAALRGKYILTLSPSPIVRISAKAMLFFFSNHLIILTVKNCIQLT